MAGVKVKLLVARTGGQVEGSVIEVSEAEAARMLERNQCVIVDKPRSKRKTTRKKAG